MPIINATAPNPFADPLVRLRYGRYRAPSTPRPTFGVTSNPSPLSALASSSPPPTRRHMVMAPAPVPMADYLPADVLASRLARQTAARTPAPAAPMPAAADPIAPARPPRPRTLVGY